MRRPPRLAWGLVGKVTNPTAATYISPLGAAGPAFEACSPCAEPLRLGRLAVLLVALALLAVGVHFLHAFQVARNAGVLLDQADQARQEADAAKKAGNAAKAADSLAKAADYLGRYLGFHPDDADAVAKLGLVLEEQARSPLQKQRTFLVLDKAVRLDPAPRRRPPAVGGPGGGHRPDARRPGTFELSLERPRPRRPGIGIPSRPQRGGRRAFPGGESGLRKGHPPRPSSCGDLRPSGVAAAPARRPARQDPGDGKSHKDADGVTHYANPQDVMEDMVKAFRPPSAEALLARSRYLREIGLFADAARDMDAARAMAPEEVEVLLASAELEQEKGDLEGARRDLEQGLKLHPEEVRFHLELAGLELRGARRGGPTRSPNCTERSNRSRRSPTTPTTCGTSRTCSSTPGNAGRCGTCSAKLNAEGPSPAADFLQARLDFDAGQFGAAAALLEDRRQGAGGVPGAGPTNRPAPRPLLRAAGEPGPAAGRLPPRRRGRAVLAAGAAGPGFRPARRWQARRGAGRVPPAGPPPPEARLQAIRLLILRNLRSPADKRNWKEAEALLDEAPEDVRKNERISGWRKSICWSPRGGSMRPGSGWTPPSPRSRRRSAAGSRWPNWPIWKRRPAAHRRRRRGKSWIRRRATSAIRWTCAWPARQGSPASTGRRPSRRLGLLEEKADPFDAADRTRLLLGLGDAYIRAGAVEAALRVYKQERDRSPDDLEVRLRLFDLSLQTKDEAAG